MRRDADEPGDDLLAAYVDGISELSPEERRRIELRLQDPAVRDEEAATRELLGTLRALPPTGEPDWNQLERSIRDAVGPDVPRPWWRSWRWLVPGLALATAAAVLLVLDRSEPAGAEPPIAHANEPSPPHPPELERGPDTVALWLDGSELEVDLDAEDLLDDPLLELAEPADELRSSDGLLAPSDLASVIDTLDDESLRELEGALDEPSDRPLRKKG